MKKAAKKVTKKVVKKSTEPQTGFLGKSPLSIILYGGEGVGKTSFASHFPRVGFFYDENEEGILDLIEYNQGKKPVLTKEITSFQSLLNTCDKIRAGEYPIQTAVFDSLTGFEKLMFESHCEKYFENDWSKKGFFAFRQGPKNAAARDLPILLSKFNDIRKAGINVILIAHSNIKNYSNPEGADYDRYTATCDSATWDALKCWAKAVFFYHTYTQVKKQGVKSKAVNTQVRYIYTEKTATYDAKNRYGLPPLIEAGNSSEQAFQNFVKAFKELD